MQNGKSSHCDTMIECPFEPAMGVLKTERDERVTADKQHESVLAAVQSSLVALAAKVDTIDKRTQNLKWILSLIVGAASVAGQVLQALGK
jgi:hypothetical protein